MYYLKPVYFLTGGDLLMDGTDGNSRSCSDNNYLYYVRTLNLITIPGVEK